MGCLDENTIVALVDGHLENAAIAAAQQHLATCESCSDLVAVAAGGERRPATGGAASGSPEATLATGDSVGRYVILGLVGRGGMGEVYGAYDPQLDRKVALKLLHQTALASASVGTARLRLLREAKAIARLQHPNVVVVHDAGEIEGRVFLAMEFVQGETLAAWLGAAPRGWRAIRDVFLAAARGLAAAHEAGLVHRDFKPQNVMVARDGSVRVTDFGLASDSAPADGGRAASELAVAPLTRDAMTAQSMALTRTGSLLGTPLYMAPEQFLARATGPHTDQFSFCVALHEALFGERPFSGESLPDLADAVIAGRTRQPPQKGRAPAFIRKLLARGLRPDPAERFPTMSALIEELSRDPVRTRRRWAVLGAAAAAVLLTIGVSSRVATRGQRLCAGAEDRLARAWEVKEGASRRTAIRTAFLNTGRDYAQDTWRRVSGLLDAYSRRWVAAYEDTCQATHVRGDQSAEVLDLRMACLEGPRSALQALTDVFQRADAAVMIEAVNAVQALPALDRCANVPLLRAVVPPPADAATTARVDALRRELARVKALSDTGQVTEGRRGAVALVESARAVRYDPLLAEALDALGWLEDKLGDEAAAATHIEEALWAALRSRRDDLALECSALLVGITGDGLGRFNDADRWDLMGQTLLRRLGPGHERSEAWLLNDRGVNEFRRGHFKTALAAGEAALAIKQRILGPAHPDVGVSWTTVGNARQALEDYRGALEAHDHSVAIWRDAYGADSPLLAHPLANRGEVLELLNRHAEAEADLRESIARWPEVVGPDHPWLAYPLTALGKTLIAEGRSREALPVLERALRIRVPAEPDGSNTADTRFALAQLLWETGEDRARARRLAETARNGYRSSPAFALRATQVDEWLSSRAGPERRKDDEPDR